MSPVSEPSATPLVHAAFYRFVELRDPTGVAERLRALTGETGLGLLGTILVAAEGINGVVAGTADAVDRFQQALRQDASFARAFADIRLRRSACRTAPFARMKVHVKREIVAFGVAGVTAPADRSTHLSPAAWREFIARDDVVVLDNRNSFEFRLGRFRNAIDPAVANFRDFPDYVRANAGAWKAQGKRVAMYCTGGIRCEKTGAWMQSLGLEVAQLDGGILDYLESMPDAARDWDGECFVFDNRIALDAQLRETGTTLEQVYAGEPDGEWRIARARRLDAGR